MGGIPLLFGTDEDSNIIAEVNPAIVSVMSIESATSKLTFSTLTAVRSLHQPRMPP